MLHLQVSLAVAATITALLALSPPDVSAAGAPSELRCEAARIDLVAKLGKKLLQCEAKAARAELSPSGCGLDDLAKLVTKFESSRPDCTEGLELLLDQLEGAVEEVTTLLRPGSEGGSCIGGELSIVASHWRSLLVAQRKCLGQDDTKCSETVAGLESRLLDRFAKLVEKLSCSIAGNDESARSSVEGHSDSLVSCILGTVTCESVEQNVTAGGEAVTTDTEEDGATPVDPVETSVESPVAGTVEIRELAPSDSGLPGGYSILGIAVSITAPAASASQPLVVEFTVDASVLPPATPVESIALFRNRVQVPPCNDTSGTAAPDPCVSARTLTPDGDLILVALTSQASDWAAGAPATASDVTCTIAIVRTDSAAQLDGLQLEINYAPARANSDASVEGAGTAVSCSNAVSGTLVSFFDDEPNEKLRMGMVGLDPIGGGGTTLARCSVHAAAAPAAGDFVVTPIDAAVSDTILAGGGLCGAPATGQSPPFVVDSYQVLRTAVGIETGCRLCECDVNVSGQVTASDSLRVLRAAVSKDASSLDCGASCLSAESRAANPGTLTAAVTVVSCGSGPTTTTTTTTLEPTTTTTLPGFECTVSISRTDAAGDAAMQWSLDYSGANAAPNGAGTSVSCSNEVSGVIASYFDDESALTVGMGLIGLNPVSTPDVLARCTMQAASVPDAGDFVLTSIDSASSDLSEVGGGVCGAPSSGQSPPYARDALMVLRTAVGLPPGCELCECDVNGNTSITASDSLMTLRAAVSGGVVTLSCSETCTSSMTRSPEPGAAVYVVSEIDCGATTTTTLPDVECTIDISRTDTAGDAAMQWSLDYSGADAAPVGAGTLVSCQNQVPSTLASYFDDESSQTVQMGIVGIDPVTTPSLVARCTVSAPAAPDAGDFLLTAIDTAPPSLLEVGGGVCGAPSSGQSPPYARDGLIILRTAVGIPTGCDLCECDPNGSSAITASDSLTSLRAATSGNTSTLLCPGTCGSSMTRSPQPGAAVFEITNVDCTP